MNSKNSKSRKIDFKPSFPIYRFKITEDKRTEQKRKMQQKLKLQRHKWLGDINDATICSNTLPPPPTDKQPHRSASRDSLPTHSSHASSATFSRPTKKLIISSHYPNLITSPL